MLKRRTFIAQAAAAGSWALVSEDAAAARATYGPRGLLLTPPAKGPIPVAFAISNGATVIDFAGPWEVFQDVMIPERGESHDDQMPFRLFTVADSPTPVRVSGGMQIVPDHAVADAPQPLVLVVPALRASDGLLDWFRRVAPRADVVMSVCTGAFAIARAGLLAGRQATTHHDFFEEFAMGFPEVELKRGRRFVENEGVSSAGGLTSGIDLALRVVERYFGRAVAERTATYMEYESRSWIVT